MLNPVEMGCPMVVGYLEEDTLSDVKGKGNGGKNSERGTRMRATLGSK